MCMYEAIRYQQGPGYHPIFLRIVDDVNMIDYGEVPMHGICRIPLNSEDGHRLLAKAVAWKLKR
mgnify:CR=1 FL=1